MNNSCNSPIDSIGVKQQATEPSHSEMSSRDRLVKEMSYLVLRAIHVRSMRQQMVKSEQNHSEAGPQTENNS